MKLNFIRQTMYNFKAFVGPHEFMWDVPGVTFIRGENQLDKELTANGASKSSIFDALCWCLFGRTPAGLRNPDVVPWQKADGGTKVSLKLSIDDKPHTIQRFINPNGLVFDGEDTDQEKLNAKLGLNFALVTNTFLMAQDTDLFFDLTPEKKMELFSETLELERWDERAKRAATKCNNTEATIDRLMEENVSCMAKIDELDTLLVESKAAAEDWAANVRKGKRDNTQRITELQSQLDANEKLLGEAQLKEDSATTELVSLRREAKKLQDESRVAERKYTEEKFRVQIAQQQVQLLTIARKELNTAKTCPTCGQSVKPANLEKHKQGVENSLVEFGKTIKEGIPKKTTATVNLCTERLKSCADHTAVFEAKQWAAQTTVERLQPEVERLRAELKELRRTSAGDQAEKNPFQAQMRGLQQRLSDLTSEAARNTKAQAEAARMAERYEFWTKGFKDIKLQLVEEVLGELEVVTNGMLADVGLGAWEVHYDIERETKSGTIKRALHVEVRSPESKGKFVRWQSWSGGERQRLKLIGALALSDVLLAKAGVETNLEILDEPALYWSADGVHDLCGFLADRAKQTHRSIFFVEHSASESAHFSNLITVVKDAKGAYILGE